MKFRGTIKGLWTNIRHMGIVEPQEFFVQYTSDKTGKSLSIANEQTGDMFQIPFDRLYKMIEKEIKNDNRNT